MIKNNIQLTGHVFSGELSPKIRPLLGNKISDRYHAAAIMHHSRDVIIPTNCSPQIYITSKHCDESDESTRIHNVKDDTTLLAKDENTLNDTLLKIKNESLKYDKRICFKNVGHQKATTKYCEGTEIKVLWTHKETPNCSENYTGRKSRRKKITWKTEIKVGRQHQGRRNILFSKIFYEILTSHYLYKRKGSIWQLGGKYSCACDLTHGTESACKPSEPNGGRQFRKSSITSCNLVVELVPNILMDPMASQCRLQMSSAVSFINQREVTGKKVDLLRTSTTNALSLSLFYRRYGMSAQLLTRYIERDKLLFQRHLQNFKKIDHMSKCKLFSKFKIKIFSKPNLSKNLNLKKKKKLAHKSGVVCTNLLGREKEKRKRKEKKREREKERKREREKERKREREREKERKREREKERKREIEKERNREREKERKIEREKERKREKREREKERKREREKTRDCNMCEQMRLMTRVTSQHISESEMIELEGLSKEKWTHEFNTKMNLCMVFRKFFGMPKILPPLTKLLPEPEKLHQRSYDGLRCPREWPNVFTIRAEFEHLLYQYKWKRDSIEDLKIG
ncbi:Nipped-B-like protein B [Nymphon striatum]|nr:Nipped-B-like protein B [Nymphon striatum]